MHVLAVVAAKSSGGVSDVAARLAAAGEERESSPVALVRLGNEDRLGAWLRSLPRPTARVMTATAEDLPATLDRLRAAGIAAAVLDMPAVSGEDLRAVLSFADLVAVRVAPRPSAIAAVGKVTHTIVGHRKPFFFIADGVGGKGLGDTAALALAKHGTVCPVFVPRQRHPCPREDNASDRTESAADSWAAPLWNYVRERLVRLSEPIAVPTPPLSFARQRRNLPRWRVKWDASLICGERQISGRLADISGGGAAVVTDAPLKLGESVALAIGSLGACNATVIHGGGSCFGLAFDLRPQQQQRLGEQLAELVSGTGEARSLAVGGATGSAHPAETFASPASSRAVVVDPNRLATETNRPDETPQPFDSSERSRRAALGKTIVLGNLKGGTGKTTLTIHLAVALLRAGYSVGCVDLDPDQATLSRYLQNRARFAAERGLRLPMPAFDVSPLRDDEAVREQLDRLKRRVDMVLVDTPGRNSALSHAAHQGADLLITPINDSFVDLDVLAHLAADSLEFADLAPYGDLVQRTRATQAESGGTTLAWLVIRNRLSALDARNKRDMHDALDRLSHRMGFKVAAGLSERVLYRELFLHGLTVLDLRAEDAGIPLSLSHIAARQELRSLLNLVVGDCAAGQQDRKA